MKERWRVITGEECEVGEGSSYKKLEKEEEEGK